MRPRNLPSLIVSALSIFKLGRAQITPEPFSVLSFNDQSIVDLNFGEVSIFQQEKRAFSLYQNQESAVISAASSLSSRLNAWNSNDGPLAATGIELAFNALVNSMIDLDILGVTISDADVGVALTETLISSIVNALQVLITKAADFQAIHTFLVQANHVYDLQIPAIHVIFHILTAIRGDCPKIESIGPAISSLTSAFYSADSAYIVYPGLFPPVLHCSHNGKSSSTPASQTSPPSSTQLPSSVSITSESSFTTKSSILISSYKEHSSASPSASTKICYAPAPVLRNRDYPSPFDIQGSFLASVASNFASQVGLWSSPDGFDALGIQTAFGPFHAAISSLSGLAGSITEGDVDATGTESLVAGVVALLNSLSAKAADFEAVSVFDIIAEDIKSVHGAAVGIASSIIQAVHHHCHKVSRLSPCFASYSAALDSAGKAYHCSGTWTFPSIPPCTATSLTTVPCSQVPPSSTRPNPSSASETSPSVSTLPSASTHSTAKSGSSGLAPSSAQSTSTKICYAPVPVLRDRDYPSPFDIQGSFLASVASNFASQVGLWSSPDGFDALGIQTAFGSFHAAITSLSGLAGSITEGDVDATSTESLVASVVALLDSLTAKAVDFEAVDAFGIIAENIKSVHGAAIGIASSIIHAIHHHCHKVSSLGPCFASYSAAFGSAGKAYHCSGTWTFPSIPPCTATSLTTVPCSQVPPSSTRPYPSSASESSPSVSTLPSAPTHSTATSSSSRSLPSSSKSSVASSSHSSVTSSVSESTVSSGPAPSSTKRVTTVTTLRSSAASSPSLSPPTSPISSSSGTTSSAIPCPSSSISSYSTGLSPSSTIKTSASTSKLSSAPTHSGSVDTGSSGLPSSSGKSYVASSIPGSSVAPSLSETTGSSRLASSSTGKSSIITTPGSSAAPSLSTSVSISSTTSPAGTSGSTGPCPSSSVSSSVRFGSSATKYSTSTSTVPSTLLTPSTRSTTAPTGTSGLVSSFVKSSTQKSSVESSLSANTGSSGSALSSVPSSLSRMTTLESTTSSGHYSSVSSSSIKSDTGSLKSGSSKLTLRPSSTESTRVSLTGSSVYVSSPSFYSTSEVSPSASSQNSNTGLQSSIVSSTKSLLSSTLIATLSSSATSSVVDSRSSQLFSLGSSLQTILSKSSNGASATSSFGNVQTTPTRLSSNPSTIATSTSIGSAGSSSISTSGSSESGEGTTVVTTVVTQFTTVCPTDTTFTTNGNTFTATAGETVTVTNCPCTITATKLLSTPTVETLETILTGPSVFVTNGETLTVTIAHTVTITAPNHGTASTETKLTSSLIHASQTTAKSASGPAGPKASSQSSLGAGSGQPALNRASREQAYSLFTLLICLSLFL